MAADPAGHLDEYVLFSVRYYGLIMDYIQLLYSMFLYKPRNARGSIVRICQQ